MLAVASEMDHVQGEFQTKETLGFEQRVTSSALSDNRKNCSSSRTGLENI